MYFINRQRLNIEQASNVYNKNYFIEKYIYGNAVFAKMIASVNLDIIKTPFVCHGNVLKSP